MPSSLLPSLSRLSVQSSDTVPTAAGPNDPFLVAIVATLANGSEDEKKNALTMLLSDVNGRYSRAGAFVNANGMSPIVALLLTAPVQLKVKTAEVLKMLLETGMLIRERFISNGGAQALMRGLRVEDNTDLLEWELMLRPFLDITELLMALPHGRARLRSVDAIEVFASVVRKGGLFAADGITKNIDTRIAMHMIVGLVFDVPLDATTGLADLTDLDVHGLASILVVDGTRHSGLSQRARTMRALAVLTSPGGGEKADAVQAALVDAGLLPALLYVLGEGTLEDPLHVVEREASQALTNVTTRKPALRFVLAELRTVLGRLRTIGAEQLGPEQSAPFNGLANNVNTYVTTSPLWFVLMDGLKLIVELLRSQAIMARTGDVAKTQLVWALSLCLPVVTWDRDLVTNVQTPHPLGDNPLYRDLVPVLMPMLHDGSQDGRARMAAKCLQLLAGGPVVEAMTTQTIVASFLAFLSDPPASDQETVNSILHCLNNMLENDEDVVFWFKTQGGLSAILKYLSSTDDRTVFSAVFMTKQVAGGFELYYDFSGMDMMEDDAQVDDAWVATVAPLVALLVPGRLPPSTQREQVVACLSALVGDLVLPEETYPIPGGLVATTTAAFHAFLKAGGMERLVPLLRMDEKSTYDDDTHVVTAKLLLEIVHNHDPMVVSDATLTQAITRFAVAGGIAALVDARVYDDARANDDNYQRRMSKYVPHLVRLDRAIFSKDHLPSWIKMLLDVTKAVKYNMWNLSWALPEERWGHINRLKLGVRSYGQLYDLLSQYRAMYTSQPERYENPDAATKLFEWIDDPKVLLRAALRRVPTRQNGKDVHVQNFKPSLLAAELWAVNALSEVLATNVSVPLDPSTDTSLTEAQTKQVAEYRELLGSAQLLQIQYAWAVAHPDAPAHFVETYRTELRINELLTMLVEKIEKPMHVDGSQTVIHRDELAQLVDQGLVEDSRKRARTSAALRASITMLYGAAKTDATMTRLFPHF